MGASSKARSESIGDEEKALICVASGRALEISGEMEPTAARQTTISTVLALRAQIATFHHLSLFDASILTTALLNRVDVGGELLELEFAVDLARKLRANRPKLACAPEEIVQILSCCIGASNETAKDLLGKPVVARCVDQLETALRCTLLEKNQASRWKAPLVKLAIVFAFHEPVTSPLPLLALEAILGGVVKSDVRRLEDVHDAISTEPLDPLNLVGVVECVSHVCVGI